MPHQAPPPGFEESREPTPEDLEGLPAIALDAVHVLERCMVEHHIAEVDYADPRRRTASRSRETRCGRQWLVAESTLKEAA